MQQAVYLTGDIICEPIFNQACFVHLLANSEIHFASGIFHVFMNTNIPLFRRKKRHLHSHETEPQMFFILNENPYRYLSKFI